MMKITELQRQKVIDVLEDLAEDAAYESYESGGEGVFSQSEMLQQIDKVIDKLDQITYPYAV